MWRRPAACLATAVLVVIWSGPVRAQQRGAQAPGAAPRVQVCKLLPTTEIRQHLPWSAVLDQFPVEEEPIGATGSSCEYPSVGVQVLPFSPGIVDSMRKSGPIETIAGVGDEAYFRNNRNLFAELYVRIGPRLLTLQAGAEKGMDTVKPGLISLAKVYVTKLR